MLVSFSLLNAAINQPQVSVVYNNILLLHADLYVGCRSFPRADFNPRSTPKEKPLPTTYCFVLFCFVSKEGKERHSLALPFKASFLCSLHHLCPLLGQIRVVKPHLILSNPVHQVEMSWEGQGHIPAKWQPLPDRSESSKCHLLPLQMEATDECFRDHVPFATLFDESFGNRNCLLSYSISPEQSLHPCIVFVMFALKGC